MKPTGSTTESFIPSRNASGFFESQVEPCSARSQSPLLTQEVPTSSNERRYMPRLLMMAPLVLHCLGSVAIAVTLTQYLHGRRFYLKRRLEVRLADGKVDPTLLGQHRLIQSDITTIVSGLIMILRWVATAWAGPLCWRVVVLIAEINGIRRRDIKWATSYGLLPPKTLFRHRLNLVLGLVLIFTLVPYPASPLLTGSISWVPSSSTLEPASHPTINISGIPRELEPQPNDNWVPDLPEIYTWKGFISSSDMVKYFTMPWSQDVEHQVYKRVIPSASQLSINSTVENVTVPFLEITGITWLPQAVAEENVQQKLTAMAEDPTRFPMLLFQLSGTGAAMPILNLTYFDPNPADPSGFSALTLSLLINVQREPDDMIDICDSTTTILPDGSTIPYFLLKLTLSPKSGPQADSYVSLARCFVYANVSFKAGSGYCRFCRVTSNSTVQNDVELEEKTTTYSTRDAIRLMPQYIPATAPLRYSLPDPANDLKGYVSALLIRSFSALWNTRNDGHGYLGFNSTYRPAVPTFMAEVDHTRAYVWLALQLSITLAGLTFLWLQSRSSFPVISDTSMFAFDIDSTEVSKPSRLDKQEPKEMLTIEGKEDEWRVIVASGRATSD
ncbi:unnamed protein product [Rhizoctonia solani]|uniref:Transmembrane protein n=1 Tax=Rhizoctonia solani TaxID=456999 RepID=A0A8H3CZZ3_9AGAM|nr:unnamed protein product [Rhizoctonia solani]